MAVESATGVINEFCFSTSDAFTDETLSSGGLVTQGPNLFQWSKGPATDYIEQTVTKISN